MLHGCFTGTEDIVRKYIEYIDSLVQDRSNPIANALELLQSSAKTSTI